MRLVRVDIGENPHLDQVGQLHPQERNREDIILGYPWLAMFEPPITWGTATIDVSSLPIVLRTIHPHHHQDQTTIAHTQLVEDPHKIVQELIEQSTIRTTAMELAITAGQYQKVAKIPKEYQCHARVFNEEEAQRFPPSWPWDHTITLKPNAPDTINCKVYPLDPKQRVTMCKWLDDMLERRYLRPSKSPITSSMFYIPKKDGEDHPIQDYCILNKYTVKDNSPLPNIKQTVADLVHAFVSTKFNIRWGYNNI